MKTEDAIVLAAAAAIGWFLIRKALPGGVTIGADFTPKAAAGDAGFGNLVATWEGWRYYDSGYGKDPSGAIYYQGQKIT
ncbi:MAG TPA: hypothetical protein VJ673_02695 [Aromatoleum sp.]|uniref:hypothetical protein n=1 Tax=Aromatoleum sp. TaxID=2307007 RepID=UPI002B4A4989|nr:hypothetical protein [Aromatoleum sp.]HJV24561.1 hypothetical protein [Aromatoleum sp.]